MKRINLVKGYVEIPDAVKVVDISDNSPKDVGIILDKDGELETLVVIADRSLSSLTVLETDQIIDKAIANLPQYKGIKAMELPNTLTCKATRKNCRWDESVRLRFYPIEAVISYSGSDYHLYK